MLFRSSARTFHKAASALVFVQLVGMSGVVGLNALHRAKEEEKEGRPRYSLLQGGAIVASLFGLYVLIRRSQSRIVLSLKLLGSGKEVEVETAGIMWYSRRRVLPVSVFESTNAEWKPSQQMKRMWATARYRKLNGLGKDYYLFEQLGGKCNNVQLLNKVIQGT